MYCIVNLAHWLLCTVKDKYGESSALRMLNEGEEESSSTSESEDEEGDVSVWNLACLFHSIN